MTIGRRLRKLRQDYNFTHNEIAAFLELPVNEVKLLEEDKIILKVSQLEKLCDLYNVDDEYITDGKREHMYYIRCDVTDDLKTTYNINKLLRNLRFLESIQR